MSNRANLANGFIASATVSAIATSFDLQTGQGAEMPATPFKLTVAPFGQLPTKTNSEIMLVTDVSADTLTVTRAQDGTTAQTFVQGDIVSNSITLADVIGQAVTVATAAATAAKVGTTTDGNYTPVIGDVINVTFSSGCNVNTPTLNIDGSGAKNIRLGNVNVGTTLVSTTSALTLQMWYDGAYWQIYGSLKNDNTTYSEISEAEIDAGTASTLRTVSGRRMQYLINKVITSVQSSVFLWTHPVGSIYMSVDSANPGIAYGGTWVAWGSGSVPVGVDTGQTEFNTVEKTGGAKTHTLTINEMPSHTHNFKGGRTSIAAASDGIGLMGGTGSDGYGNWGSMVQGTGGGQSHNNLQPYITCYMFKRIS